MTNCITNQRLERQIHHIVQYLPKTEELEGQRGGTSFYRKVNEGNFVEEFKKTHRSLNGLKDKYLLTSEQCSIITDTQTRLVEEIEKAFEAKAMIPANLCNFLEHYRAS